MKKYLTIGAILSVFLALSCTTQRKCYQKWEMRPDTIKITFVRDSLVYRDTIVYVPIQGKTVIDSVVIPCPPPPPAFIPDTARAETELAVAKAWWSYPVIKLDLYQKENLLEVKLDSAIMEAYHWKTEYEKITQVIKEKYVPKIYRNALHICIVIFSLFFIWFGYKLFKFIKK